MKSKFIYFLSCVCMLSMTACDSDLWKFEDENKGAYAPSEFESISTMLENSGEFDEWVKVLNYSGSYSVLNSMYTGDNKLHAFTHFAPTDEALQAFYASKQVSGIEELGAAYAKAMVQTMTYDKDSLKLTEKFTATVDGYGWDSESGETVYCVIDVEKGGFLMVNLSGKKSIHVERNYIKCTNGFVYQVEGVLEPLVETVFDRVNTGNSTIMVEALMATGYDKELATIADTTYVLGKRQITERVYTFLNVNDQAYAEAGIRSLSDLKNAIVSHSSDKTANPDSLLKQYVEYHIFKDLVYSTDLLNLDGDTVHIRETMAKNQILMVSRDAGRILFNTDDIADQEIDSLSCNIIAKNGLVHNLTGWMPVYEPKQATVVWDLTAYSEVRQYVGLDFQPAKYATSEAKYDLSSLPCYKVEVGEAGKSNSTYSSLCYVTCKSNLKNCLNNDRLVINVGQMGSVTMSTPTLVKGKYSVSISMAYLPELSFIRTLTGCKGGMMRVSIDGDNVIETAPYTTITKNLSGMYEATLYEEVKFKETRNHEFKIVVLDPAATTNSKFSLQFDAITFTPIE